MMLKHWKTTKKNTMGAFDGAEMIKLEKALPLINQTEPFVNVWQQYHTANIADMGLSALAELRALRDYGNDLIHK